MSTAQETGLAVLTGDLIGYTNWSEAQRVLAFEALRRAAERVATWPGAEGSSHLERVRGDGWQFALSAPHFALRTALTFRAVLRGAETEFGTRKEPKPDLDTRIAIGIGERSAFDPNNLAGADGSAFVLSGRALDAMEHAPIISFATENAVSREAALVGAIARMCDVLSRQWTARQAAVMYLALSPDHQTVESLAQKLGIQRQSVYDHFSAAQASAIRIGLEEVEQTED